MFCTLVLPSFVYSNFGTDESKRGRNPRVARSVGLGRVIASVPILTLLPMVARSAGTKAVDVINLPFRWCCLPLWQREMIQKKELFPSKTHDPPQQTYIFLAIIAPSVRNPNNYTSLLCLPGIEQHIIRTRCTIASPHRQGLFRLSMLPWIERTGATCADKLDIASHPLRFRIVSRQFVLTTASETNRAL